ncbi:MAG: hypothetical protein ACI9V1_003429 [Spirosomataceae bacterium]
MLCVCFTNSFSQKVDSLESETGAIVTIEGKNLIDYLDSSIMSRIDSYILDSLCESSFFLVEFSIDSTFRLIEIKSSYDANKDVYEPLEHLIIEISEKWIFRLNNMCQQTNFIIPVIYTLGCIGKKTRLTDRSFVSSFLFQNYDRPPTFGKGLYKNSSRYRSVILLHPLFINGAMR